MKFSAPIRIVALSCIHDKIHVYKRGGRWRSYDYLDEHPWFMRKTRGAVSRWCVEMNFIREPRNASTAR